ncbi:MULTISPECIES: right-handed parallel beta-helix repeat-containing protein [unclassified Microcoleus]|uniref:right-handed parallel beta-helix repeat-containing protein n=1 Tax=unclassified Microcoleus TaxID=2642155 RepID=UPI0025DE3CA4|nr:MULTISPECIES: right-handed parallel beta-helix repeat-containing protein [unclassified Microcoleus]
MKRIALIVLATVLAFTTSLFGFVNTAHANTGQPAAINPSVSQILAQPAPTRATIVVNSLKDAVNDPSVTTLRDAINKANADSEKDLIEFDRSLFSTPQIITLQLGELDIIHSLDIIAPQDTLTGRPLVTVSGNNASRVFKIQSGAAVTLAGLIVESGRVTSKNGGGIENLGKLTLDSSIVRNNSALNSSGSLHNTEGGGIDSTGDLTVNNSSITGNSAHSGSGIYSHGNLMVNNSTISDNSGTWFGGGIYHTTGTLTVNNSTISDNSGIGFGGGIYNDRGTMRVDKSTISSNSANSSGGGGGIYNDGGNIIVNNSTISRNLAGADGGGIFNNSNSTITVINSTISRNSAGTFGGGINNLGTNTVINSTISDNSGGFSGGITNLGTSTVIYSTISNNSSKFSSSVIHNGSSSFTVRNTIISGGQTQFAPSTDVSGSFASNGYNLIGNSGDSTGFGTKGDIVGTINNPIDPLLSSLSDNSGPTQTMRLLPNSPAIRAGDPKKLPTDPETDQRGKPRRAVDGSADIGAFQLTQ